ncbi:unnamed protein product [Adineta ricciae]|uniref:Uncharacterized protein n=1 Tax=Adineta ricciae TaxID=249248 RepID=A0A814QXI3_ADIRI|nr:unnamed protein product [Adineta ricciae]CAF1125940.1 unnamed protein product [Adineta ricciae]
MNSSNICCLLLCFLFILNAHQTAAAPVVLEMTTNFAPSIVSVDDKIQDGAHEQLSEKKVKRRCGKVNLAGNFGSGDVNVDVEGFGIINGRINGC